MSQSRKKIGLFTGGYSAERGVALQSAAYIQEHLDQRLYEIFCIDVQRGKWLCEGGGYFDLNTGRLRRPEREVELDAAYVMIHGAPAEDGLLQGYFDMIQLPYTCCSVFSSALTFDKQATKKYLQGDVPMASSICLRGEESLSGDQKATLSYPLFVKPNKQGSSFGITKVKGARDLETSIAKARQYDDEVMIETFISGREFSCGMVVSPEGLRVLPLTEIKPFNEFFDFAAKYEKQSEEITPADLPKSQVDTVAAYARKIYDRLQCKGLVRADFIMQGDDFYFLELNTIPGMSPTSIVPQQAAAAGINPADLVRWPLEGCLSG